MSIENTLERIAVALEQLVVLKSGGAVPELPKRGPGRPPKNKDTSAPAVPPETPAESPPQAATPAASATATPAPPTAAAAATPAPTVAATSEFTEADVRERMKAIVLRNVKQRDAVMGFLSAKGADSAKTLAPEHRAWFMEQTQPLFDALAQAA